MADHGDNYKRVTGEDGREVGKLGPECGHHCGVITTGLTDKHVGHCSCSECHGEFDARDLDEVPMNFTSESGGVDPRGIV